MNVILVGYRGCGKSTIGRRLADRLWQNFIDLDELIVREAGRSIRRIFEEDGEPRFRDLETLVLREAMQMPECIIALGGGTVLREDNRQLIKAGDPKVIYLRCAAAELLRRIESDPETAVNRPSLTSLGGGIEEIQLNLQQREPLYRQVMTSELDVTTLSPEEAVVYIARML